MQLREDCAQQIALSEDLRPCAKIVVVHDPISVGSSIPTVAAGDAPSSASSNAAINPCAAPPFSGANSDGRFLQSPAGGLLSCALTIPAPGARMGKGGGFLVGRPLNPSPQKPGRIGAVLVRRPDKPSGRTRFGAGQGPKRSGDTRTADRRRHQPAPVLHPPASFLTAGTMLRCGEAVIKINMGAVS